MQAIQRCTIRLWGAKVEAGFDSAPRAARVSAMMHVAQLCSSTLSLPRLPPRRWLLTYIVTALFPALPLYFLCVLWLAWHNERLIEASFHCWAGEPARVAAAALLRRLPEEPLEAFPPVGVSTDAAAESAAEAATGAAADPAQVRFQLSAAEKVAAKDGGKKPAAAEAHDDAVTRQLSAALGVHCFVDYPLLNTHAAAAAAKLSPPHLDTRAAGLNGQNNSKEAAVNGNGTAAAGRKQTNESAAPGGCKEEEEDWGSALELSKEEARLEKTMAARCHGHLWEKDTSADWSADPLSPDSASAAADDAAIVRAAVDYFAISALCSTFLLWTPASTAILTLFSCIVIEPYPELNPLPYELSGYRMIQDVTQKCFTGPHARYTLAIGIPGLLIICGGLPAMLAVIMRLNRERLSEHPVVRRYGFVYFGALWCISAGGTAAAAQVQRLNSCVAPR